MTYLSSIIIGAGQCGLAMSQHLTQRSLDHVILERGDVANSWRTERWDSLRLLTPNFLTNLPGAPYWGPARDGFMTMPEVVRHMTTYARGSNAPVKTGVTVSRVAALGSGYTVETNQGTYCCNNLVLATGACNQPVVPAYAAEWPANVPAYTPFDYKRPSDMPDGRVLIVGGSATGVQLARELQLAGREVWLSVGEHVRMPRTYRGRDIKWWMQATGLLDQRIEDVDDPARVRRTPSLQLAGLPEAVDLNALQAIGVKIVGRLAGIRDGKAMFSGALANHCAMADLKMNRLLDLIDDWVREQGMDAILPSPHRFAPTRLPETPDLDVRLDDGTIAGVLWATGFRPDYSWLDIPVLDRRGRLKHDKGVVAPGLYAMGLPFMRRRKSTLICGAGDDAAELATHMMSRLDRIAA